MVGTPTKNNSANAGVTSITCAIPTGFQAGDLLLWQVVGNTATSPAAPPTGFTNWQLGTTTNVNSAVWYKFATGTESSPLTSSTLTSARTATIMVCYHGVDPTTFNDVATSSTNGTTATTFGSITPTTVGAKVVAFGAQQFAIGTTPGTGATTNLSNLTTEVTTAVPGSNANVMALFGDFTWSSGAFTANMSNSAATARTIGIRGALRPALSFEMLTPTPRYF